MRAVIGVGLTLSLLAAPLEARAENGQIAAGILGGLTNPMGALVGGLVLGLIEAFAIVWVSSAYKDVVAFSLIIAIMILMPHGMLGRAGRRGG